MINSDPHGRSTHVELGGQSCFLAGSVLKILLVPVTWWCLSLGWLVIFASDAHADDRDEHSPRRHALLIGCTRYDHLPEHLHLVGPDNDVLLMRSVLETAGVPTDQITVLCDALEEPSLRPTRDNIVSQFKRLAKRVGPHDQVFIHLSGHGSQQPNDLGDQLADIEPDALDEVFCPADVSTASPGNPARIPSGITDDDFRVWLDAIRDAGASVFLIADTCHSGTITRASDERVIRSLRPESLGIRTGHARTQNARMATDPGIAEPNIERPDRVAKPNGFPRGRLLAIYAAQPGEVTFETQLPLGSPQAKCYGMLTYTLAKHLMGEPSLSCRELVRRIHAEYIALGILSPTPFVEGEQTEQSIFGRPILSEASRGRYTLQQRPEGLLVNAGELHGLTIGSVFAIDLKPDPRVLQRIAHVRVVGLGPLSSTVQPCAYDGVPAMATLSTPVAARLVHTQLAGRPIRVSMASKPMASDLQEKWKAVSARLNSLQSSSIQLVQTHDQADWMIRDADDGLYLTPLASLDRFATAPRDQATTMRIGPIPDHEPIDWLATRLKRVARAQHLIQLAVFAMRNQSQAPPLSVSLVVYSGLEDSHGRVVDMTAGRPRVAAGTIVGFEIQNQSRVTLDASLFFVDSHFGIESVFPVEGMADNRILPAGRFRTRRYRVNTQTTGLEHAVAIAVRGRPAQQPTTFPFLSQPSVEVGDPVHRTSQSEPREQRPFFESLLQKLDNSQTQRDRPLAGESSRDWTMQLLSWTTTVNSTKDESVPES
ncbi:caspase family protein [Aporhodopirellula aestuarii]|uniref:Caspase family protein n=1 Tax=Aporhodopirellula aestuarii TaxID=2950107 RepID=A0ABT0UAQ2_9BACT|nr:caspase family protein [Aporhodopirellula aestuarii]MCM2373463.1 caspase family protein [Aporhodopirellula aestuarii]